MVTRWQYPELVVSPTDDQVDATGEVIDLEVVEPVPLEPVCPPVWIIADIVGFRLLLA